MKHCLSFLCLTSHDSPSFTRNVHEKEKIYQEQRYLLSSLSTCLCSTTPLTRQFPILESDTHEERQVSLFPEKTPGAVSLCHREAIHLLLSTLLSNHLFLIFGIKKALRVGSFAADQLCCQLHAQNQTMHCVWSLMKSALHYEDPLLFVFVSFLLLSVSIVVVCPLLFLGHTKGTAM